MITVKKNYEFNPETDLLGKGGFGRVYRATDVNLGMQVALKKYTGNLPSKYGLFEEIRRAIKLNHPNLVRYYDAFELEESSPFGDKIQMGVLEYVNGGDLMRLLRRKPNHETLKEILIGLMDGMRYLHQNGIIHRDLKPENILIQEESGKLIPKIADFGISKVLHEGSGASSLVIGSVEYMAPEQFNVDRYGINKQLHTNLDLWSLGVIIYEVFTGNTPFGKTVMGMSRDEIMHGILTKELSAIELQKIPEPFRQITRRCLVRDAANRALNIDELLMILYGNAPAAKIFGGTSVLGQMINAVNDTLHNNNDDADNNKHPNNNNNPENGNLQGKIPAPSLDSALQTRPFQWIYLVPILTAVASYAFFNSKKTLFGFDTPEANYMIYPAIVCSLMLLVNMLTFLSKERNFAAIPYLFSFLTIFYYLAQSLLIYNYSNISINGLIFKFKDHAFARYYPLAAIVLLTLPILLRPRHLRWFDALFLGMGYALFVFWSKGILVPVEMFVPTIIGIAGASFIGAALLWKVGK